MKTKTTGTEQIVLDVRVNNGVLKNMSKREQKQAMNWRKLTSVYASSPPGRP